MSFKRINQEEYIAVDIEIWFSTLLLVGRLRGCTVNKLRGRRTIGFSERACSIIAFVPGMETL